MRRYFLPLFVVLFFLPCSLVAAPVTDGLNSVGEDATAGKHSAGKDSDVAINEKQAEDCRLVTKERLEAWGLIGRPDQSDATLPFLAHLVEGRDFPLPMGVNFVHYWQEADWDFDQATLDLNFAGLITTPPWKPNINSVGIITDPSKMGMTVGATTNGVKFDTWIFPFLNVFGTLSKVKVDVEVGLQDGWAKGTINGTSPADWEAGLPSGALSLDFSGMAYGAGFVLAGGYKHFFISSDFTWVFTKLSYDSSNQLDGMDLGDGMWTFTCAPRIGYNYGTTQVWAGARYLKKESSFDGTMLLKNGRTLDYNIEVDAPKIHYTVGARYTFAERWEVLGEVGFGQRNALNILVGYRF